jgi:hypothetical protein
MLSAYVDTHVYDLAPYPSDQHVVALQLSALRYARELSLLAMRWATDVGAVVVIVQDRAPSLSVCRRSLWWST